MLLRLEKIEPKSTGCTLQLRFEKTKPKLWNKETSMLLRLERTEPKSTGCTLQLRFKKTEPKLYKQQEGLF